ncbi:MAG: dual specificity protein phosphatase family protein [Gammaproteobacteria bacterium]|nr:dual specificity protein phosphatase family protein [Gammaproteobacteria bacterium]
MFIQIESRILPLVSASLLSIALVCSANASTAKTGQQPSESANWATSLSVNQGLPNLNRINRTLYRSAQPTKEGFEFLSHQPRLYPSDQPIKTILSLRAFHNDRTVMPKTSPLRLEQIRFKTWHPEHEDIIKFLRIATTPELQPILVHCQHGSDRTGTMIAIYRIVVEGWTKKQAKDEMVHGNFGFHPIWQNLLHFIDDLDVDALKAELAKDGTWKGD